MEHCCHAQHGLNKGVEVFGKKGKRVAFEEAEQLHMRNCFKPLDVKKISTEERKQAITSSTFLKEKTDGTMKGHTAADGGPQQEMTIKEDTSIPTASPEAVLLTDAVEATNTEMWQFST